MANTESTKNKILRVSTTMFLEVGYSKTSPQMIAKELKVSTGNLTYYYPTKEHLLAVLTDLLCKYQWKMIKEEADDGISSLLALCFVNIKPCWQNDILNITNKTPHF